MKSLEKKYQRSVEKSGPHGDHGVIVDLGGPGHARCIGRVPSAGVPLLRHGILRAASGELQLQHERHPARRVWEEKKAIGILYCLLGRALCSVVTQGSPRRHAIAKVRPVWGASERWISQQALNNVLVLELALSPCRSLSSSALPSACRSRAAPTVFEALRLGVRQGHVAGDRDAPRDERPGVASSYQGGGDRVHLVDVR